MSDPVAGTKDRFNLTRADWLIFGAFALIKIALHILTDGPGSYGYFRDEFYYLDCASHLDWGYVDQPPFSLLILAMTRALLGASMLAIRLPVILAGAATIVAAGLAAREMGGGRFARSLTCLSVLASPVFLTMGSFFSMNAFDQLFWAVGVYLVARIIRTGDARLWIWFGLVAGLGLENKYSMAFFGLGLAVAMAFTPERKYLGDRRLWLGGLIATLLFLPHLIWQVAHGWPTLDFMRNARLYKNMPITFVKFFLGQLPLAGPLNALVWIPGLLFGFLSKRGRPFMIFSLAFIIVFAVFVLSNGKVYYLSPAFPMLFAMGALWIERLLAARTWAKALVLGLVTLSGIASAPLAIPVLPPESFLRYQEALGLRAPQQERAHSGPLPQHLGDRLGWEELVETIVAAYGNLSPEDRSRCSIFVGNYGEAGAVDLLGKRYGLPRAISGHMTHYLWGPGDATGEVVLAYFNDRKSLDELFEEVTEVARFHHPYVMDRQNDRPLYLCRRLKVPISAAWPRVKTFY